MSLNFKHIVLGLAAGIVLVIFLGGFGPAGVSGAQTSNAYKQMGVYEEVLQKIKADYVTVPNLHEVTNGALHGLLESLDSDSAYLTPTEYKEYLAHENDGNAQVGLIVSERGGYSTVVSVVPNSPAFKENIEDGDVILSIDGKSTYEMSVAMVRLLLQGKPGSQVHFQLIRPQRVTPYQITLTRVIETPPPMVVSSYAKSSILYIKPYALTASKVSQIIQRLKAIKQNGKMKVLLDLRNVAQGPEKQGLRLANAFISSGTLGSLHGQTIPTQVFAAKSADFVTSAPLVVLVNHGTAGAAELFAGAILDRKRGDVVGDVTFGEGAVVKTFPLPDGAAMMLTVGKYETPSGTKIEDSSITPNYIVSESINHYLAEEGELPSNEQKGAQTDTQLEKALSLLQAKSA
jgi:carboxyl-terminal processing protease